MKKLWNKLKNTVTNFIKWLWAECKDWRTLVLFGIVCLVVGLPVWGCYLLGFVFKWEWALWVATGMWAFWMLPGAPYFALCVSITLAIKRIFEKKQEKALEKTKVETENQKSEELDANEEIKE